MKRKRAVTIGIVLCTIAVLSAVLVVGPLIEPSGLRWAVTEGDEIKFSVMVFAWNLGNATGEFDDPMSFAAMNNTVIRVTILHLPDIPLHINSDSFLTEVVGRMNITMVFENGSEIPEEPHDDLTKLISSTILPVGNWELIDAMFRDEDPNPPFMQTWYFSRLHEEHMEFGYTYYGPDYSGGWKSNISLDTGVPMVAERWSWVPVSQYTYRFVVRLDETSSLSVSVRTRHASSSTQCLLCKDMRP